MKKFYLLTSFVLFFICTLNAQDTANFVYNIGLNNKVSFTNTSHLHGDAPRKAFWFFGDGKTQTTAPLASTSYQYNVGGTYTVCLRIYKYSSSSHDSVLTGEVCKTFRLPGTNSPDSCKATFANSGSNATALTQLFVAKPWHNHEKKPEQICWNFGDNHDSCIKYDPVLSNNYAVYHNYSKPGQYNVCVKIRYQGGCVSDYCQTIRVEGNACEADYTVEPVPGSPLSKHFVAQPRHLQQKKPLRICWDFGDGSVECKSYLASYPEPYAINHTYAKAGQYNVCVNVLFDGGCESKKCKAITIEKPPTPSDSCFVNVFEVATNLNNLERHFYAGTMQDRRPERICWIFGDGKDTCIGLPNPSTTQSLLITHHYPSPGLYPLCVKIKYSGGCEASKCLQVVIRTEGSTCGGYIVDSLINQRTFDFKGFSIQNLNDHVISWRWSFGDGTSSNDRNASHAYAAAGKYEVCLYIKTDLGCETKICKQLVVPGENKPILQLTPNPVTTILHAVFLSVLQEQVSINIYNVNGLLVRTYTRNAVIGTNTWEFDVAGLPQGVYSVIVKSSHQLANAIFFKQ